MRLRSLCGSAWRRAAVLGVAFLFPALAASAGAVRQEPSVESPDRIAALLKGLVAFEYSSDDAALHAFRSYVRSRRNDPAAMAACETALLVFLEGEATPSGKQAVCRELGLMGTDRSVPLLEKMLALEATSDMARCGLEGIPGAAADEALIRGLSGLSGGSKLGVVSSLGNRRCAAAVPVLGGLLRSSDGKEADAAADALGRIGGPEAMGILAAAVTRAPGGVRARIVPALLACAAGLLGRDDAAAVAAFDAVLAARPTLPVRRAAFRGKIAAAGEAGRELVLSAMGGRSPDLIQPAIDMVPAVFDPQTIKSVCALLPRLSDEGQVQFVAALASFPKDSVLETLIEASDSPIAAVRVEALRVLGRVGDGSIVLLLAARAANAADPEKRAARESLRNLGWSDVDGAIVGGLAGDGPEAVRVELVQAAGERRLAGGKNMLMKLVRSESSAMRLQAIRALGRTAGAEDMGFLLDLLSTTADDPEREEVMSAIAATAMEHALPTDRAGAVESRLSAAKGPSERASLLRVLGKIGEDRTLPVVREALDDGDALVADSAARAIAGWPTAAARDDALRIARSSSSLVRRVLALEGFIRMVGLEPYRAPEGAVASLREALAIAERPEERRLVVAALPSFACSEALELAEGLAGSPDVGNEARVAAASIRKELASRKR